MCGKMLDTCEVCGTQAPVKHVKLYQHIGLLIIRLSKSIKGNLCKGCINKYFWEFTLVTLLLGWWGVISFIVTPIIILNNVIHYIGSLGLARTHSAINLNEPKTTSHQTEVKGVSGIPTETIVGLVFIFLVISLIVVRGGGLTLLSGNPNTMRGNSQEMQAGVTPSFSTSPIQSVPTYPAPTYPAPTSPSVSVAPSPTRGVMKDMWVCPGPGWIFISQGNNKQVPGGTRLTVTEEDREWYLAWSSPSLFSPYVPIGYIHKENLCDVPPTPTRVPREEAPGRVDKK
jgi:hypothetical protein